MTFATLLESVFKWLFLISAVFIVVLIFQKDKLPEPEFYDTTYLREPVQLETEREEFVTQVNGHKYTIIPKFEYELQGVVVSYHDADSFLDIWHHKRWQDFINQRDLCVIWGENVTSGVYKKMNFSNDSWTCWAFWPDSETGKYFKMNALSNNHLLIDNDYVKNALMASEPGDHIRFKGYLVEYSNKANGFKRGTSTIREDTGNGACETVYLSEFEIVQKANAKLRQFYGFVRGVGLVCLLGFLLMFVIAPVRIR